ncbi:MAG TPA: PAS domain S-box protein [Polyangiaceae bacterium]|nr:PAS domain S-box protein [Polyangiaceae bacterium]
MLPLVAFVAQRALWSSIAPFAWFLFYPIIFVAPRLGGVASGLFATSFSALLVWTEFIPPYGALVKAEGEYWLALAVFVAIGAAFSWFHGRLRAVEKRAALALREAHDAERRKEQLLDTVADPVIIVSDTGRIEYANTRAASTFGYTQPELVGLALDELIPERYRAIHDRHLASFMSRMSSRPMGAGPRESLARRKDGSEFPIEVSLNPVSTSKGTVVSTVVRDVSQRRSLEAAARLQAERLASAVASIPDPFWLVDANGSLVQFNASYAALWGEVGGEITIGMTHAERLARATKLLVFNSPEERASFFAARAAAASQGGDVYDIRLSGGRKFRVSSRATADGGAVNIAVDLTADERRERELDSARTEAETANNAKTEFLASMSHELRTPLNAVLGFAQLLQRDKRDPLSEKHRHMVEQISTAGEHLLGLIDDVLDLARIEKQGIQLSGESVIVSDVVSEALDVLRPAAAEAGVQLIQTGDEEASVLAGRRHFLQMLLNLGSNAIKYNRRGGSVTFAATTSLSRTRVSVTDTGIGVPLSERPHLFRAFHRAGQESGPIPGSGIGLAITKRMAELMGGEVGYTALPAGSVFWIELPSGDVERRRSSPALGSETEPQRQAAVLQGTVLYVEDNVANVELLRAYFGTLPEVELLTAPTAEIGLVMARTHLPDLVLMDLNLPGMSGTEALSALRSTPETAGIPVVAVSAAAFASDRDKGKQAGFASYLTKPIQLDLLDGLVNELLSSSKSQQPVSFQQG